MKPELPFEVGMSYEDEYEIFYVLPLGYKVDETPDNSSITSEFGSYKLSFVKSEGQVKVVRKVQINKGLYPKEKYNDYISFRKRF